MKTIEQIEKRLEEKKRRENIICPVCGHIQDNEIKYHYVTYWGDDGAKECYCEQCNETFIVKEIVEREFYTTTKEEYDKDPMESYYEW